MRTHFSLLIIPIVYWSCSAGDQMETLNGKTSLDYSLDTVLIDPGEELLFVAGRLYNSDLSPDGKFLYNYNQHDHSFEQIDLDEKRLVRKWPFEKEGPNGTGDFFRSFFLMDNDHILIVTFPNPLIFELNGKKIKELKFQELITDGAKTDERQAFLVEMNLPDRKISTWAF